MFFEKTTATALGDIIEFCVTGGISIGKRT